MPAKIDGVVVLDKPLGPTSHDVVGRVRRTLSMRRVGHAGTLDPLASGVLVVLLGEGTKLAPYLTAHDKQYTARIAFGRSTTTLDAAGATLAEEAAPGWLRRELAALAASPEALVSAPRIAAAVDEQARRATQVPPAHSAIKVEGRRAYDRARAGEALEMAPRAVEVTRLRVIGAAAPDPPALPFVDLELAVSKGYYVRSLARDLGERLGVPAHLAGLRRTASGPFTIAMSVPADAPREVLAGAAIALAEAASMALPIARLEAAAVARARAGRPLGIEAFSGEPPPEDVPSAWLAPGGELVAIGAARGSGFRVLRGFAPR